MVRYTAASPYQLQEKQLDYVVIYADRDIDKAVQFDQRLKGLQLDGCLYDGKAGCPFDWIIQGQDAKTDLYKRSTFKFFIITDELAEDVDFIMEKNEAIQADLRKRDQTIVPIWYVGKYDLSDDAFDALYGITSLQGLDPKSSYFDTKVKKMAAMEMFTKRKEDRAIKQRKEYKEYEAYMESKSEYLENHPPTKPKGPKYKPQEEHEGSGGKGATHIHIHVDGSAGASSREPVQCYTVAKQFWRNFQTPMGSGLRPGDERLISLNSMQPTSDFDSEGMPRDIAMDEGPSTGVSTPAPSVSAPSRIQQASDDGYGSSKTIVNGQTVQLGNDQAENTDVMETEPVGEIQHTGATEKLENMEV